MCYTFQYERSKAKRSIIDYNRLCAALLVRSSPSNLKWDDLFKKCLLILKTNVFDTANSAYKIKTVLASILLIKKKNRTTTKPSGRVAAHRNFHDTARKKEFFSPSLG